MERSAEIELLPLCRAAGLGVLPSGDPRRAGFLTGRCTRDAMPADGRVTRADEDLEESAKGGRSSAISESWTLTWPLLNRHRRADPQVALAWLLGVPGVIAPIIGPRTLDQPGDLLGATEMELDDTERGALEEPAPPPEVSPHRMLCGQIGQPDVPSVNLFGRA